MQLLIACNNHKECGLEEVFDELLITIDSEKLNEFKNDELDSAKKVIELIENDISNYLTVKSNNRRIERLALRYDLAYSYREIYLSIAFHKYLNHESINFFSMKSEINKIQEYERLEQSELNRIEVVNLILSNDSICNVLDTIELEMPIIKGVDQNHIYYTGGVVPDSIFYLERDLLQLKAIVIDKSDLHNLDPTELIYDLKILEISDSKVMNRSEFLKIGDTIKFYMGLYLRPLGR